MNVIWLNEDFPPFPDESGPKLYTVEALNGTEGEQTSSSCRPARPYNSPAQRPTFLQKDIKPCGHALEVCITRDFCNRYTFKNPRPAIAIPFLLHSRVRGYPRILSTFSDYLDVDDLGLCPTGSFPRCAGRSRVSQTCQGALCRRLIGYFIASDS